jgi:hypothetical protein
MSATIPHQSTPTGPGSVSGAPNLAWYRGA